MNHKPLDKIARTDIEYLVQNQISEARSLDFKLELPGFKDADVKEFLADASSFANTAGGDLIFGVREEGGIPIELPGLAVTDLDAVHLRLENLLRDGIEPRLASVDIQAVEGFQRGPILIVRIPRSYAWPHRVKASARFYKRNSRGKYPMDIDEIRSAFAASESFGDKFRRFRAERLSIIASDESPAQMPAVAKVVMHIVPFADFRIGPDVPLDRKDIIREWIATYEGLGGLRYNADGFLKIDGLRNGLASAYSLLFWNGAIETVWADIVRVRDEYKLVRTDDFETRTIRLVSNFLKGLNQLGVPVPFLIMTTLTGVRGARVYISERQFGLRHQVMPIDRDTVHLPDVVVVEPNIDVLHLLRPIFDGVWNASGVEGSPNYDQNGKRKRPN